METYIWALDSDYCPFQHPYYKYAICSTLFLNKNVICSVFSLYKNVINSLLSEYSGTIWATCPEIESHPSV